MPRRGPAPAIPMWLVERAFVIPTNCPREAVVSQKCTATSKQSGERCKRWATPGATVCTTHGGRTPRVQAKAKERLLETRLNGELRQRGWEPVDNPSAALLDVAGEVRAWLTLCREQVAQLKSIDFENDKGDQDVRPAIALYERAQDRAVNALSKLVSLGIQDRVARSQELTAQANLQALTRLVEQARTTDATPQELILALLGGTL